MCPAAAHDRENAGLGGRRVLVSRDRTGKTLTEHRADRAAVIRKVVEAAGVDPDASLDVRRCAADLLHEDGTPRFRWEPVDRDRDTGLDYVHAIALAAQGRAQRRAQYEARETRPRPRPPRPHPRPQPITRTTGSDLWTAVRQLPRQ